jgi:hypothetical protein
MDGQFVNVGGNMQTTMLLTRDEPISNADGTLTLKRAALTAILKKTELQVPINLWVVCLIRVARATGTHRIGLHLVDADGHEFDPPMREEVLPEVTGVQCTEHRFSKAIHFDDEKRIPYGSSMRVELRVDGVVDTWCEMRFQE